MKEIRLTQGKVAIVNDEDYERLVIHHWFAHFKYKGLDGKETFYAWRHIPKKENTNRPILPMHHDIIGKPPNGFVNNQKENLRHVTIRQNQQNRNHTKSSRFPGVTWHKRNKKWQAQIEINGEGKYLGIFNMEKNAHNAYKLQLTRMGGVKP